MNGLKANRKLSLVGKCFFLAERYYPEARAPVSPLCTEVLDERLDKRKPYNIVKPYPEQEKQVLLSRRSHNNKNWICKSTKISFFPPALSKDLSQ